MKTNRKTHQGWVNSRCLPAYVIATCLALLFAASVAFRCPRVVAQSKRKATTPSGAQLARGASEPPFRSFEFETVSVDSNGAITNRRKGQARYYVEDVNGVRLEMVEIPAGTFQMGSSAAQAADAERNGSLPPRFEMPQHRVTLPMFYMSKFEVTQAQWRAVANLTKVSRQLNPRPLGVRGDKLPVDGLSWDDAMEFCARLSKVTARTYRLPTEAEWEYACRAGTTTAYAFGETITPEVVNYDGNFPYGSAPKGVFRNRVTPVGSLGVANGFGLYDMHGNAWEWCLDSWHESYNGAPADGSAWEGRADYEGGRVLRGGTTTFHAADCRSASRFFHPQSDPYGGIRVVSPARVR